MDLLLVSGSPSRLLRRLRPEWGAGSRAELVVFDLFRSLRERVLEREHGVFREALRCRSEDVVGSRQLWHPAGLGRRDASFGQSLSHAAYLGLSSLVTARFGSRTSVHELRRVRARGSLHAFAEGSGVRNGRAVSSCTRYRSGLLDSFSGFVMRSGQVSLVATSVGSLEMV